jgi:Tfp pilus assembly protein PilF
MLVTLPFVLLLMDCWPLKRLWPEDKSNGVMVGRLIWEKVPLFIMSAISCIATFVVQKAGGAVMKLSVIPGGDRIGNAFVSYCDYIVKMFAPVGLAIFYPYPTGKIVGWEIAMPAAILLAITFVVILLRRRRYLLVGWLWYLGTLVPVIGFVQVGEQVMADRYTYIPLTGIFIMLVWLAGDILMQWRFGRVLTGVGGAAILIALGVITFVQVSYWRNSMTLFTHTAAVTANNTVAHNALGVSYADKGDYDSATREFETVLKIDVNNVVALYNIAKGKDSRGETSEAIKCFNRVLAIVPGDTDVYIALATIESNRGNFGRAMTLYRDGLKYHPENGDLHGRLGSLLLQAGLIDEAIKELETAVKLKADSGIYGNLGVALFNKGDAARAAGYFSMVLRLDPANAEAHYNLGNIFLVQNLPVKAVSEYEMAIKAKPNYAMVYDNLGVAFTRTGQTDKAIGSFRRAVELDSNNIEAHFNLAMALSGKGLFDEAVEYLHKVVELAPQDTTTHCQLAEMLLLHGRIEQATTEYEQVLKIDPANENARAGLEKIKTGNTTSGATPVK